MSSSRGRWAVSVLAVGVLLSTSVGVGTAHASATGASGSHALYGGWETVGDNGTGVSTTLANVRSMIGAASGTAANLTGAGVGIALIDTGVAPVPGLPAAQVVNGPDLSIESQSSSLRYLDTYGHGTHMAGIVVGNDTATGTRGLAPKAKITSLKVGTANGAVDVSQVMAAMDWVVAHRLDDPANPIRVINLSYGSGGTPSYLTDPLQYVAERAWAAGIVVVASVGNSGTTNITDPATDPFILNVGSAATQGTVSTADDSVSTFSNVGGLFSRKVDVVAPGERIVSLRDPGSNIDLSYPAARVGSTLFRGSGTSQAAAVTSAAVALLLQARPTLLPSQVKQLLANTGTLLTAGNAAGRSYREINLNAALAAPTPLGIQLSLPATGLGSLQDARGVSKLIGGAIALLSERSVWGTFNAAVWLLSSQLNIVWSGGKWMGFQVAGNGWTGSSWASRTWAGVTWTCKPWDGSSSWIDPGWDGHYWVGQTWAGGTWTGHYWSTDDWATRSWS